MFDNWHKIFIIIFSFLKLLLRRCIMRRTFYLILVSFLFSLNIFAQDSYPDWENYTNGDFITAIESKGNDLWVGTKYGGLVNINLETNEKVFYNRGNSMLPNNHITEILLDKNGFKWVGTTKGLLKFDKEKWRFYLKDQQVRALALDSTGNIWAGTWEGVTKISNSSVYQYSPENSKITSSKINTIAVDKNDNIWFGTDDKGIMKYDGYAWQNYDKDYDDVFDTKIMKISIDNNNNIWAGTSDSFIFKYNGVKWTVITNDLQNKYEDEMYDTGITDIAIEKNGNIWLGVKDHLFNFDLYLAEFDGEKIIKKYSVENSILPDDAINAVHVDDNGNKWIGTEEGLVRYNDVEWEVYNTSNSGLKALSCNFIDIALNNDVWINTNKYQLIRYDRENWHYYDSTNSPMRLNVHYSHINDDLGNLWLSVGNKLYKFRNDQWQEYQNKDFNSGINLIFFQKTDKNVWLITHKQIAIFENGGWKFINKPIGNDYNYWNSVLREGENNTPWLMTQDKLARYNGNDWTFYDYPDTSRENFGYLDFDIDNKGIAWIISKWGSLLKFDSTDWTEYNSKNSDLPKLSNSHVRIDKNSNKWITYFDKVYRFNDSVFTAYTSYNSFLPEANINKIASKKGLIWVSTDKGIGYFDDERWYFYNTENSGIADNFIYSFDLDNNDDLWITHEEKGVSYFMRNPTSISEQTFHDVPSFKSINYPNPFKQHTNISYELEEAGFVTISIYDSFGEEIASLVNKQMTAGRHITEFNAEGIAPGVYYYTIRSGGSTETGKFVVVR